jgi:hypothetical protein
MNTPARDDIKLLEVLNRHPTLKRRVEALADIVADRHGGLARAGEAERRVINEVGRLGGEVLVGCAEGRIARTGGEAVAAPETRRAGKKLRWHTTFGTIAVEEPLFRAGTRLQCPFAASAAVSLRGCSQPLQRAVTDFSADVYCAGRRETA